MSSSKNKTDIGLVRDLAQILREADLSEIEVEHDGFRVRVTKSAIPVTAQATVPTSPVISAQQGAAMPALATPPAQAHASSSPSVPENAIRSPMVGTVYLAPDPQSEPYITVGKKVKKGDVLMLVEAMKTYNPVESDRAGTVKAIYVQNAQPVEYGEPLVLIE